MFSASRSKSFTFTDKTIKLSKIFPNVEYLFIEHATASNWIYFESEFPSLVSFDVKLMKKLNATSLDEVNGNQIKKFLQINSKIKFLKIRYANLKFLKTISEILVKLTSLDLKSLSDNYLNYQGDVIHFNTVKHLILGVFDQNKIPENTYFDQLVELNMYSYVDQNYTEKLHKFISNQVNRDLNIINIKTERLSREHFLDISSKFPMLHSIFIESKSTFYAEDILNVVKNLQFLNTLEMGVQMTKIEYNKIERLLGDKWNTEIILTYIHKNRIKILINRLVLVRIASFIAFKLY